MANSPKTPSRVPKKPAPPEPSAVAKMNTLSPHTTDLAVIAGHRYGLYNWPGKGFSTEAAGPYLEFETAQFLVDAGLCHYDNTGGAHGSIKVTDEGRAILRMQAEEAAAKAGAGQ